MFWVNISECVKIVLKVKRWLEKKEKSDVLHKIGRFLVSAIIARNGTSYAKKTVVGFSDCIGVCCDKIENRDRVVAQL